MVTRVTEDGKATSRQEPIPAGRPKGIRGPGFEAGPAAGGLAVNAPVSGGAPGVVKTRAVRVPVLLLNCYTHQ